MKNVKNMLKKESKYSDEEIHFMWWMEELIKAGYIIEYKFEPCIVELSNKKEINILKRRKEKKSFLLHPHIYTPDFGIKWNEKAINIFITDINSTDFNTNSPFYAELDEFYKLYKSFIEIKPIFDQNNMTRAFIINQKWIYEKYKKYINLIECSWLFAKTFTPKKYLFTDISGNPRKIKFKIRTLEEYINDIKTLPTGSKK